MDERHPKAAVAAAATSLPKTAGITVQEFRATLLQRGVAGWAVVIALSFYNLPGAKESYDRALDSFPNGIGKHAGGLSDFMWGCDIFLAVVSFGCWVVTAVGLYRGLGAQKVGGEGPEARQLVRRSQLLVRVAWGVNLMAPFVTLLCYAARTAVDWDGAVHDLCDQTFMGVMGPGGTDMELHPELAKMANDSMTFETPDGAAVTMVIDEAWAKDYDPAASVERKAAALNTSVQEFCTKHGMSWNTQFFGDSEVSSLMTPASVTPEDFFDLSCFEGRCSTVRPCMEDVLGDRKSVV